MSKFSACPVFRLIGSAEEEIRYFWQSVVPCLVAKGLVIGRLVVSGDSVPSRHDGAVIVVMADSLRPLAELCSHCDLVFVTAAPGEKNGAGGTADFVPGDFMPDPEAAVAYLLGRAQEHADAREVWGCILIGGRSSRMGSPKHLITHSDGRTWLERNLEILEKRLDGVAISGRGEIPAGLKQYPRIPDVPDVQGPLSGILALQRWQPDVSWLVLACDLPAISVATIDWLCEGRRVGSWARIPKIMGRDRGEPLLARYEPQCAPLFEEMSRSGRFSLHPITGCDKVELVDVPASLQQSWRNVNTPDELEVYLKGGSVC